MHVNFTREDTAMAQEILRQALHDKTEEKGAVMPNQRQVTAAVAVLFWDLLTDVHSSLEGILDSLDDLKNPSSEEKPEEEKDPGEPS